MASDLSVIGENKIKKIPSGEVVEMKTLWQEQSAVVIFFRRWGCMFCRLWAKEVSLISEVLKKNNIRLIGIGVEEAGSKEFVDGKFFEGELYYVDSPATYQKMGFKRFNLFSMLASLLWKQSREAISKGRSMGLGGDLKGDWVQVGGALLVERGGIMRQQFFQQGPAEHLSNLDILKQFNLEGEYKPETMANSREEEKCTGTYRAYSTSLLQFGLVEVRDVSLPLTNKY